MNEKYKELYIEGKNEGEAISRLAKIIKILRRECPWDRVQTHESLTTALLEETYEAVDAITKRDTGNLKEELGDVLLHVVLHSRIAEEEGSFSLTDVINEECEKMIRRHPHIFSEENIKTIDKVLEKWENIKGRERAGQNYADKLKEVPVAMPALMRSEKVQSRAAVTGFDWKDASGAFDKLEEEIGELRRAYESGVLSSIFEEFGDLLFSMVNVARFLKISPEESLNRCTEKFIRRFGYMEKAAMTKGRTLEGMTLEEMDKLWIEAKDKEYK